MDYPFRHKPLVKKNFSERKNKVLSEFLFSLYRAKWYQKLGLDHDFIVNKYSNYRDVKCEYANETKYPDIKVDNILFYDLVRIEEGKTFKKQIEKVCSKLKPFAFNDSKSFDKLFDKIDKHYNAVSFGTVFKGIINPECSETDLIKYISIGYVKARESSIIITYKVHVTDKFNELLKQSLESDTTTEYEIIDVSLKHFFSKKKYSGFTMKSIDSDYWTNKLFDEVSYQLKNEILRGLKTGVFIQNNNKPLPRITTFQYGRTDFANYEKELYRTIGAWFRGAYSHDDIRFVIDERAWSDNSTYIVNIFLAKREQGENVIQNRQNDVGYVSSHFSDEILPQLALINLSSLQKDRIVHFRNKIFKHLRENRASLFLSRIIKLKNQLTLSVIDFERFTKDLTGDNRIQKRGMYEESVLPEALRECRNKGNCTKKHDFKSELFSECEYAEKDIRKSFNELSSLFQTISEDNHGRSNMRLQRLLFWLAILGVILTIYGANTSWCNSWIEFFLNKIGLSIPRVK